MFGWLSRAFIQKSHTWKKRDLILKLLFAFCRFAGLGFCFAYFPEDITKKKKSVKKCARAGRQIVAAGGITFFSTVAICAASCGHFLAVTRDYHTIVVVVIKILKLLQAIVGTAVQLQLSEWDCSRERRIISARKMCSTRRPCLLQAEMMSPRWLIFVLVLGTQFAGKREKKIDLILGGNLIM